MMNFSQGFRRAAAITTVVTALGGCLKDGAREPGELERGLGQSPTHTQRIAKYSVRLLEGVTNDRVRGLLGHHLDQSFAGDVGLLVELSELSQEDLQNVLAEVVDAEAWETPQASLESELDFIQGYSRSSCAEQAYCDLGDELQLDEQTVVAHAQILDQGWDFFAGQAGVEQRLSGIPRMLAIAPLQMMLGQEVVGLRHARGLDTTQATKNFRDTACSYRDTLLELEAEFDARASEYGKVTAETLSHECTIADAKNLCTHEQSMCFANPRGEDECKTRFKKYGDWGNGKWSPLGLRNKMKNLRAEWMQDDVRTILGGDDFGTVVGALTSLCEPEQ